MSNGRICSGLVACIDVRTVKCSWQNAGIFTASAQTPLWKEAMKATSPCCPTLSCSKSKGWLFNCIALKMQQSHESASGICHLLSRQGHISSPSGFRRCRRCCWKTITRPSRATRYFKCKLKRIKSENVESVGHFKLMMQRKQSGKKRGWQQACRKCSQQSHREQVVAMRHSSNAFIHPLPESCHCFADISVLAIFTSAERRGGAQVLIPLDKNFHTNAEIQSGSASLFLRDRIVITSFFFVLHQWRACQTHDGGAVFGKCAQPALFSENRLGLFAIDSWATVCKCSPCGFHVSLCREIYSTTCLGCPHQLESLFSKEYCTFERNSSSCLRLSQEWVTKVECRTIYKHVLSDDGWVFPLGEEIKEEIKNRPRWPFVFYSG